VKKRKFLTLPGLELRPLGRPARSQSLYRLRYPDSENEISRRQRKEREGKEKKKKEGNNTIIIINTIKIGNNNKNNNNNKSSDLLSEVPSLKPVKDNLL
jgi:hypothetical protein